MDENMEMIAAGTARKPAPVSPNRHPAPPAAPTDASWKAAASSEGAEATSAQAPEPSAADWAAANAAPAQPKEYLRMVDGTPLTEEAKQARAELNAIIDDPAASDEAKTAAIQQYRDDHGSIGQSTNATMTGSGASNATPIVATDPATPEATTTRYRALTNTATTDEERAAVFHELLGTELSDAQREALVNAHAADVTPESRAALEQFFAVAAENDRYAREYRSGAASDLSDAEKAEVFHRLLAAPDMTDVQRVALVEAHGANVSASARADLERFFGIVSAPRPATRPVPAPSGPSPVQDPGAAFLQAHAEAVAAIQTQIAAARQQLAARQEEHRIAKNSGAHDMTLYVIQDQINDAKLRITQLESQYAGLFGQLT